MDKLQFLSAMELVDALRERRIGVEELTRFYIQRIRRYDGPEGLNAVAELDDSAIDQARRLDGLSRRDDLPLFGLPLLIKDNIDVAGLHTTAGSLALADNRADRDADIVANLRRRGAVILGKTNLTEFANYTTQGMPGGYSSRGGQVLHAYDRAVDPSGSSSGSAVAMSAGLCAAAIGTDTSFSVIGCATVNGVAGLKPTHGSLSGRGIVPIAHSLDSAGPLTRRLRDALLLYQGMRATTPPAIAPMPISELRIAVNAFQRDQVSEAQLARYDALFARLRSDGARLAEVTHPHSPEMKTIMRCEFRHDLEGYLATSNAKRKTLAEIVAFYEANPEACMKYGCTYLRAALDEATGRLDDPPYREALAERKRQRAWLVDELRQYDACVMTGPTNLMHFTGLPSVALPLGMDADGLPRGIILYGADERKLYAAALTIERYCEPVTPPNLTKYEHGVKHDA